MHESGGGHFCRLLECLRNILTYFQLYFKNLPINFVLLCSNLKNGLKIIILMQKNYRVTDFEFQGFETLAEKKNTIFWNEN